MVSQSETAREAHCRRALARHGMRLSKSRARHPEVRALQGGYMVVNTLNVAELGAGPPNGFSATLEDVECYVSGLDAQAGSARPQVIDCLHVGIEFRNGRQEPGWYECEWWTPDGPGVQAVLSINHDPAPHGPWALYVSDESEPEQLSSWDLLAAAREAREFLIRRGYDVQFTVDYCRPAMTAT